MQEVIYNLLVYYEPNVNSIIVTKGGHLRGNGLYRISKAIGRGVANLYKQLSICRKSEYRNVIYLKYSTY